MEAKINELTVRSATPIFRLTTRGPIQGQSHLIPHCGDKSARILHIVHTPSVGVWRLEKFPMLHIDGHAKSI